MKVQPQIQQGYSSLARAWWIGTIIFFVLLVVLAFAYRVGSGIVAREWLSQANAKYEAGDLDGAIADYSRALALDPKNSTIYNNRGLAILDKCNFAGALANFNHALALDPNDAKIYNNRALTETRQCNGHPWLKTTGVPVPQSL